MRNRRWNRAFASVFGYFWLPCPLCGQEFGGHEWASVDGKNSSIPDPDYPADSGRGVGICPDCTAAGRGYDAPEWSAKVARLISEHSCKDAES